MNILLFYSHGNGPLARCLDLLIKIIENKLCGNHVSIILPFYNSTKPSRSIISSFKEKCDALGCDCSFLISNSISEVLNATPTLGRTKTSDYLNGLARCISSTQDKLYRLFDGPYISATDIYTRISCLIPVTSLSICITREIPWIIPIKTLEIGFGPQSLILEKFFSSHQNDRIFSDAYNLPQLYSSAEQSRSYKFLSIPCSTSHVGSGEQSYLSMGYKPVGPVLTPSKLPDFFLSQVYPGPVIVNNVYIYVSGTNVDLTCDISRVIRSLDQATTIIYSNRTDLVQAIRYLEPSNISEIQLELMVTRAGWGMVWQSLLQLIPLVLLPPSPYDDPEIFINYEILLEQNLAMSMNDFILLDPRRRAERLAGVRHGQRRVCELLQKNYGGFFGQESIAYSMLGLIGSSVGY